MSKETVAVRKERGMYRVYKLVEAIWVLKHTFFTAHQANRYIKGFARNNNGAQPTRRKLAPSNPTQEQE